MQSLKFFIGLVFLFSFQSIASQSVEIKGQVSSRASIENIHVINKTAQIFTTTNVLGEFTMIVKLNDTIMFSSIQHIPKRVVIDKNVVSSKVLAVTLQEQINQLDEIVVGKVLTDDLQSDIGNVETNAPINFYDVGIPGYKGKPATQSERRLHEAGEFKPKMLLGLLGGGIPLNPILNGISGRTKELKERVRLETNAALLRDIKARLSQRFFSVYKLDKGKHADFFYFCEEDKNFRARCEGKTNIEIFEFLKEKLTAYKKNLGFKED